MLGQEADVVGRVDRSRLARYAHPAIAHDEPNVRSGHDRHAELLQDGTHSNEVIAEDCGRLASSKASSCISRYVVEEFAKELERGRRKYGHEIFAAKLLCPFP